VALVEAVIALVLGALVIGALYLVLMRSTAGYEEASEETQLLVGVRGLLEHVGRDLSAGHAVLRPESGAQAQHMLVVARYLADDPSTRVSQNQASQVYPFMAEGPTTTKLHVLKVTYGLDTATREIVRKEEDGTLEGKSGVKDATTGGTDHSAIAGYTLTAAKLKERRSIATSIATFDLHYLAYDPKGQARLIDPEKEPDQLHKTACVGVVVKAVKDTGVYAVAEGQAPTRRQPTVEIATKFWLARRLSEVAHPEYFSSADDDLRF
jgi:hypothetical protein